MKPFSFYPLAGIDNASQDDAALQVGGQERRNYVREALNVDIESTGRARMRAGLRKLVDTALNSLWQSPLHGDVFAQLGDKWVKVDDRTSWATEPLATIGEGPVNHLVLNNVVLAAGSAGIFQYDGQRAQKFTIDTPPAPLVVAGDDGALDKGSYGVALSWLRNGMESSVSRMTRCEVGQNGQLAITLPMCLDPGVTHVRLYVTRPDGTELRRVEDYHISKHMVGVSLLPKDGAAPQFQHLEPMPTGIYFAHWRGRLLTARANVLRFSEPMAYHLHNPLRAFVQMPQRITFVQPVDGGIWVGQVDHVAFLSGTSLEDLQLQRKSAKAPVPGSAVVLDAEVVGTEISAGGAQVAAWLAENGYVIGTASGSVLECNAGRLKGIAGNKASTVVFGKRLTTAVI